MVVFSRHRNYKNSKAAAMNKDLWELVRFCSRLNVSAVGAAGKLLAYFEKKYSPVSIVSYADRRLSRGKLYNALGFRLDRASKPDYWYWNRKKGVYMPESRVKYQKHKLPGLLQDFNPELSESENMKRAGFTKNIRLRKSSIREAGDV